MTRSFDIIDCEQRSEAWYAARLGRLTSSRAGEAFAVRKDGKEAAGRKATRVRMALERITGVPQESDFTSAAMQHGIDTEAEAVAAYEARTGAMVARAGFLRHREVMAGYSPDGYVGEWDGLIEVKCPEPWTHWDYLSAGKVPVDYRRQVCHALWLSGAAWCDWLSYCPSFPQGGQLTVVRFTREDCDMDAYERDLRGFLTEVDQVETEMRARISEGVAA